MIFYILALLIGIVAGLRTLTPLAVVGVAAHLGFIPLRGTPLTFLDAGVRPYVLVLLAFGELVVDKMPWTPSRKVWWQSAARFVSGGVCGAAIVTMRGVPAIGLMAGVMGAVIGTYGGAAIRGHLAKRFGKDLPGALLEDVIAIGGAILVVVSI